MKSTEGKKDVNVNLQRKNIPVWYNGKEVGSVWIGQYNASFAIDADHPECSHIMDLLLHDPEKSIVMYIDEVESVAGKVVNTNPFKYEEPKPAEDYVGKIASVKQILAIHGAMVEEVVELEKSIKQLRGGKDDWENGIKRDDRKPVQLLYRELMAKRMNRTMLELTYVYLIRDKEVQQLNDCRDVVIRPSAGSYDKYPRRTPVVADSEGTGMLKIQEMEANK